MVTNVESVFSSNGREPEHTHTHTHMKRGMSAFGNVVDLLWWIPMKSIGAVGVRHIVRGIVIGDCVSEFSIECNCIGGRERERESGSGKHGCVVWCLSFVAQSHNRNSVILRGGIRLGSGLTGVLINANERKTQTTHTW